MIYETLLARQREETRSTIKALLEDGSDPDALYTIEHHFSSEDQDALEKIAVEAFKLGYDVTDPDEVEGEASRKVLCIDVFSELALDANLIDMQVDQLLKLAISYQISYDGWGTYFEALDGDEEEEYDGDKDENLNEVYH